MDTDEPTYCPWCSGVEIRSMDGTYRGFAHQPDCVAYRPRLRVVRDGDGS